METLHRERRQRLPPVPRSFQEYVDCVEDPQFALRRTPAGQEFYAFTITGNDEEGFISLFVNNDLLPYLKRSRRIQVDGTFKCASTLFEQICIIHFANDTNQVRGWGRFVKSNLISCWSVLDLILIKIGDKIFQTFPVFFAFMTRLTEAAYKRLLRAVAQLLGPEFTIDGCEVMTDWEQALRNAIRQSLPGGDTARLAGCWFHFAQVREITSL